jgi:pilus assembly protein CpaE
MSKSVLNLALWYQDQDMVPWLTGLCSRTKRLQLVCSTGAVDALERCLEENRVDLLVVEFDTTREDRMFQLERLHLRRPELNMLVAANSSDPDCLLQAMRLGAREYLVKPIADSEFASAIVRVVRFMEATRRRQIRAGRTVAVVGSKGGLGVTTIGLNLAAELAALGGVRVGLFDFNLVNPDVGVSLDLEPQRSLVDLVRSDERLDELMIDDAMTEVGGRFYALCGPTDYVEGAEVGSDDVEKLLLVASDSFDWLVLDLTPGTDDRTIKALDKAHLVLLVTQATVTGLKNVQRTLSLYSRLGYGSDKVKVVVNRTGRRGDLSWQQVKRVVNDEIYHQLPDDSQSILAAEAAAQPLERIRKRSPLRKSFAKLAARLNRDVMVARVTEPNPSLEEEGQLRVVR